MIKYFARKLTLKKVTALEAVMFLTQYHIMGKGTAQNDILRIGLYNEQELLQLLTFRRYRGMQFNYECSRACTKKDVIVVGGLSRIMSKATETLGGEIGFAIYPEIFSGKSMQVAGFEYVKTVAAQDWHNLGITKVDYYRWLKPNYSLAIGCIYLLTFDNNMYYVGQHTGCTKIREDKQAFTDGYAGGGALLINAKKKHKYEMSILDLFYSKKAGNYREAYWIKHYNSCVNGYNIMEKGHQPVQFGINADYHSKVLSVSQKAYFAEHPKAIEFHKKRMLKQWQDPAYRDKVVASHIKFVEEHPEYCAKNGDLIKQAYIDRPELREKARQHAKKLWEVPGFRENYLEKMKQVCARPEHKKKVKTFWSAYWAKEENRKAQSLRIKAYHERRKQEQSK